MSDNLKIAVLLPQKEIFSIEKAGAIALCVRDFTAFSRYKDRTTVFGGTMSQFSDVAYLRVTGPKKWYWRDSYAYSVNFSKIAKEQKFTHVEVHNRPLILHYLNQLLGPDILTALHSHNDPQGMKGLKSVRQRQKLLDQTAAVYCVSEYIKNRFVEGVLRGREKVHVIHNGIDTRQIHTNPKEKIILYVGRTIQEKGVLPLAKAFRMVAAELPEWKFVMCGNDRLGKLSEYERLTHAELEHIGDQCVYTGFVSHDQVMQYFSRSEISIVPSVWQEPFGRTALEAISRGSAVITSGSGGLREIVGDVGLIVNPVTPDGLAEAMLLLAKNGPEREEMQKRGCARAAEIFDIRKVSASLDDLRAKI